MFFNTAIINLLLDVFFFKNVFGQGGLIYTEFWVFITNALVSPLLLLFDFSTIKKKIQRKKILKQVKETDNKCAITQAEANQFYFFHYFNIFF